MPDCDVIVIGSGLAGVHASETLLEHGLNVCMVDGGNRPPVDPDKAPAGNFEDVRRTDSNQAHWFLGHDMSGIPLDGLTGGLGGGQVSGNRGYVVKDTDKHFPLDLKNALVIQSLAEGGLGAAWGAACSYLSSDELTTMGLDPNVMPKHYERITRRIGISGPGGPGVQPAMPPDLHASNALQQYEKKKTVFAAKKISVSQPHSAILTQSLGDRHATTLADMEYWADPGKSVYRPQYSLDALKKNPKFQYEKGWIVTTIEEKHGSNTVHAVSMDGKVQKEFQAKKIILAAGAVGSARIALRSHAMEDVPIPFIGKPHVFSACLDLRSLGRAGPKHRSSLCSLLVTDEERPAGMAAGCAQLYGYRSLLLFRLLESVPIPTPEAMNMLALWSPSLVIADIRFPAMDGGTLSLQKNKVEITAAVSDEQQSRRTRSWKRLRSALWSLGMPAIRNMQLPEASTSHYGGTLPCGPEGSAPLTTDEHGQLRSLPNVYVADASVFKALPAKPHSLTIMANADRIASELVKSL